MKEKTLIKIALICSIIGIVILFLLVDNLNIEEENLNKIKPNQDVYSVITGKIVSINTIGSNTFIEIEKKDNLNIILFGEDKVGLEKGDIIQIKGKVNKDKEKYEMIADEVRVMN